MPMGVSMLPRFAAMVMSVTVRHSDASIPVRSESSSPKGTKVRRETSLVMNILLKKQRNTSISASCRWERMRRSSVCPTRRNSPIS